MAKHVALMEKYSKVGCIKGVPLDESEVFNDKTRIVLDVAALNIAAAGSLKEGGLIAGVKLIAGPSRHFKSNMMLIDARNYLRAFDDAIVIFYDNEFGITEDYLEAIGIDPTRVLHCPFETLEQLKSDIAQKLSEIKRGDHIIFIVDSLGNAASAKEVQNALDEKNTADFTRAKEAKSLFRIITPMLTLRDIPFVGIQHVYQSIETYSKTIVSGGTGGMLAANTVWIIGRQQDKEKGGDLEGWDFIINVEKSRFVREKSKIPLNVSFEGGINIYSGLMDIALETGHAIKPKAGWYAKMDKASGDIDGKNWRLDESNCPEFWDSVLADPTFEAGINKLYKVAYTKHVAA